MSFSRSAFNDLRTASRLIDEVLSYRPEVSWHQQPQAVYCCSAPTNQRQQQRPSKSIAQQQESSPDQIIVPASAIHDLFGDVFQTYLAPPQATCGKSPKRLTNARPVAPRADVSETQEAYHIQADLPGVLKENIHISVDQDGTLTLHGRYGTTVQPQSDDAQQQTSADAAAETASVTSHAGSVNKYKTSVQDDDDYEQVHGGEANTRNATTTATTASPVQADGATSPHESGKHQVEKVPQQATSSIHVNERFSGTFTRSWRFAAPIDAQGISAKMEHGVLSLTIPKRQRQSHRIEIA